MKHSENPYGLPGSEVGCLMKSEYNANWTKEEVVKELVKSYPKTTYKNGKIKMESWGNGDVFTLRVNGPDGELRYISTMKVTSFEPVKRSDCKYSPYYSPHPSPYKTAVNGIELGKIN